nr:hypothetical protein [Entomoplasma sp. MP1]
MQNPRLIDPTIECLVKESDETYADYLDISIIIRYIYFLWWQEMIIMNVFNFDIFEEIVNEYKEKYNENLDFIPYLGYFSKITLNGLEIHDNWRFIEPKFDLDKFIIKTWKKIDIKKS